MGSKRSHRDEESDASHPMWPKRFDIAPNSGVYTNRDASSPSAYGDYTIAWICALSLELSASRAMLDEEHYQLPAHVNDENTYVLGRIDQHNVVMVCLPDYGTINAAIVATNLKRSFPSIRATLMVGIGGGVPGITDTNLYLGDVVVGTRVMQYDMGKEVGGGRFEITADPKIPTLLLNSVVSKVRSKHGEHPSSSRMIDLLGSRLPKVSRPSCPDRLFQALYEHIIGEPTCHKCDPEKLQPRGVRLFNEPHLHYGVIVSGNSVIKNGKRRDNIAQQFDALCFEMEAAGMMDNLQCLPIRGICDYSDSHKNKEWQNYAAATAAAYARELLEELPPLLKEPGRAIAWVNKVGKCDAADGQASARRQRLLESLSFPQIDVRKTTIRAAHAKTCRWLVCHLAYQDWLNPSMQSQNHGFLWVRGKAGAGKSTIMKFIYLESKKSDGSDATTASFFFNARGDYLEKSIAGMYRSLLMQLLKEFPDLQSVLDDTDIVPWSQQTCPDLNALKELLRSAVMALGQRSFTCFVDALDECDEQEARDMVQFFEDLAENTTKDGIQFRICFSSRPYPYISIRQGISLTLEDESGHADDLAQYVKSNLSIEDPLLLADLQSRILSKAAGIFLWIVLVVDILNKEEDEGGLAIRDKLSKIPARLSDLFKNILMRDQKAPGRLLLCVLWILCAKKPLSPAEFRHALWVGLLNQNPESKDLQVDAELPDVKNINACVKLVTSSSKGLAEITKSKQPTVQFIHESVRDYLVREKGLQDLWPELGFGWKGRSHEMLRHCCTTYLDLPGVQAIVYAADGRDEQRVVAEKYPFLKYASQQVLHHADAAALAVPQDDFLSQFFASAGVSMINFFERHKTRRYGVHATPLYVLADKGLGNLIRTQLKKESAAYVPQQRYDYPFFAALANGHKSAVAALLGLSSTTCDGVDIIDGFKYKQDLTNYKGRTPLSWAAQEGRLSIAKVLVEAGADVNEIDRYGGIPLLLALEYDHTAVARLLIENGANINIQDDNGCTALLRAIRDGREIIARFLIENGANINVQDDNGWTALMWTSQKGDGAVAELLIENEADVDVVDNNRRTALLWASQYGHKTVARLLIKNGADVNAQDDNGWTALLRALQYEHKAMARLLIENGVDINFRDSDGWTALIWALERGYKAVARLLIEKGADINVQDDNGWTALMWALEEGHELEAQLLIENGADVHVRDNNGRTALTWASQKGYEAVAQLLRHTIGKAA
ncbi:hypothetical protein S7711_09996 [Stachybotrys chartarum IBT 7711]|uniref:Uncharacterized protein n=1 Tax=Stachybotrys chartarum (strain CBS 109288 / IBT 7711) TaxID=1280523 RepID=A0A084B8R2_STACB|nr:hypothetical protein S7711_09996 [Stachybotrys chartarum IBT 7711]KFA79427.1 hypothetical protein S40288_09883 [Stachybotrys chartarum IBT 40288]